MGYSKRSFKAFKDLMAIVPVVQDRPILNGFPIILFILRIPNILLQMRGTGPRATGRHQDCMRYEKYQYPPISI